MKIQNILFRADSSSTIGTGHIMRDLVLASQYKNSNIIFAVQNLKGNINHKIIEAGFKIEILKSNNIKEVYKLIEKYYIDMLIIDHYGIDYKYEMKLKVKYKKLKILCFDDTYEKHHCDILLNHNISGDKNRYKGLVPKKCELRCGSEHTLLRDEFIVEKARKRKLKIKNSSRKIFLAMGGADHRNINIDILKVIKRFKSFKVNLVTTNANQNLDALKKYCKNKKWIKLHINSNKIAKLMGKSDFAIVTPSVTVNEVYYLGIPLIAIKTADNQIDMYNYLKKKKILVLSDFNKIELEAKITKIIRNLDNGK